MSRTIEEIAADLEALPPADFDSASKHSQALAKLYQICDELRGINNVTECAPLLFKTMERLDGSDFGNPGPIVHLLETWRGDYEQFLIESIHRKPTQHSVWMINRILNANPENEKAWMQLLASGIDHPLASSGTKASAQSFYKYQLDRRN